MKKFQIPDPMEQFKYFTSMPNCFIDYLMLRMDGSTWKVLTYFCRKLYGFQKGADRIAMVSIEKDCGISGRMARINVQRLLKAGIIKITQEAKRRQRICREYGMNVGAWFSVDD